MHIHIMSGLIHEGDGCVQSVEKALSAGATRNVSVLSTDQTIPEIEWSRITGIFMVSSTRSSKMQAFTVCSRGKHTYYETAARSGAQHKTRSRLHM